MFGRTVHGKQLIRAQKMCILFFMKRITFRADERLVDRARLFAKSRHKTLSGLFREWLGQFRAQGGSAREFDALMKRLKHVRAGNRLNRDELNQR
jgi:hypothetical protein